MKTPLILVIFGITGDLTKRLLFPAICNLGSAGLLDTNVHIIGLGSESRTPDVFRESLTQNITQFVLNPKSQEFGLSLIKNVDYIHGDFSDPDLYQQLKKHMDDIYEQEKIPKNALFYLAVPPTFFGSITTALGQANMLEEHDYFRHVVIEKPFGKDLASAKELNTTLLSVAKDDQIFRIDHFLGKETVQNIMALRFANSILEPIWNRNYIDSVQLTVAETLGVEARGRYYDHTGALRDMIPNHLFQVLSLIAMESPTSLEAEDIQNEKEKVFHAIQPFEEEDVLKYAIRGQYDTYRSEPNVSSESPTETYAALKLNINNWRWLGVPFYIRTGKRLQRRTSEVVIRFKRPPSFLFKDIPDCTGADNLLRIHLQPDEGVSLRFSAKVPGPIMRLGEVDMRFQYKDYFGTSCSTGYEALLYDCINGDHTLFPRAAMVEAGWQIIQPILDVWSALSPRHFPNYATGSWGPKEADDLLEKEGRQWIL